MWNNSLILGSSFFQKRLFAMFGGRVTSATPVWYWFLTWTNKSIHCLRERINFTQKSVGFGVFLKLPFLTNTFVPTNFVSLNLCSFKHSPGTKQHIPEKSSKIKLQTGKPPNTGLWTTLRQAAKVKSLSKTSNAAPKDCLETSQLLSVAAAFQKPEAEDDEQNEPSKRESLREKKLVTQQMWN